MSIFLKDYKTLSELYRQRFPMSKFANCRYCPAQKLLYESKIEYPRIAVPTASKAICAAASSFYNVYVEKSRIISENIWMTCGIG